jgi:hypothetical protein
MKKRRGCVVSHKKRVELIELGNGMKLDLAVLESRLIRYFDILKKDYWTLEDLNQIERFRQRLKD